MSSWLRGDCLIGRFSWCQNCFLFSIHKKGVTFFPNHISWTVATMLTSTLLSMKASMTSLSLAIIKSTWKLILGSPKISTKLPAYQINWLNYNDIRCKLVKYKKEEEGSGTIEEDLLSLLSKFLTREIKFALVAPLSKLELDIKDLPIRKNKPIELFSKLILDDMSSLGNSSSQLNGTSSIIILDLNNYILTFHVLTETYYQHM